MGQGVKSTKTVMKPLDLVKFSNTALVAFTAMMVGIASQSEAIQSIAPGGVTIEALASILIPAAISGFRWWWKSRQWTREGLGHD